MSDLSTFKSDEFGTIRTIVKDGELWFAGKDVAESLGYANTRKALQDHVESEDRGVTKLDTLGGVQEMTIINESGLYSLILSSKLPAAKKFKQWITTEVIPSIRSNGGYIANQENMTPEQIVANALIVAQRIIQNKDKLIQEMKPKAEYFDELVDKKLNTNFRETAKELGIREKDFIKFLQIRGYIYKDIKGKWMPYASKNKGLFEVKEYSSRFSDHTGLQTLITPRGRETFRLLIRQLE